MLHEVEDDALAAEECAGVVADDGERAAFRDADAVEDLRMADDFEAGLRWVMRLFVEAGEDLEDARDAAEAGDDQFLAGDYGCRGAQVGVDRQIGRGVAGGLVFDQRLLEQSVDAAVFPFHLMLLRD